MNRQLLLLLSLPLVVLFPLVLGAQEEAFEPGPRTVILVRHAEKAQDGTVNPPLSEEGTARAEELALLLGGAGVTHLFSSEYLRTQATLQPLADASGLEVLVRPAREMGPFLEELRRLPSGAVACVAGHSNTVPALVRGLGGDAAGSLEEDEYDKLFLVTLTGEGSSTLQLSFGARALEPAHK